MSVRFCCEEEDESNKEVSVNKYKYLFTNYEKNEPSLSEALIHMYITSGLDDKTSDELTKDIIEKCNLKIDSDFSLIKKEYDKITKEDAYIICSYTCEAKIKEFSPYKLLNLNLVSDDRKNGVRNISKYLYILLKSLRKLPRYYPKDKNLYRCLTTQINISKDNSQNNSSYCKGNQKTFWGFTSTSPEPESTYAFLNKNEKMKSGTVFTLVGDIWGYNIELFNCYNEKEILLEPERKFIIDDILPPINGIINIRCTVLNSNLILTDTYYKKSNIISKNTIEDEEDYSNLNEFITKFEMEAKIDKEIKYASGIGVLCNIPSKNIKALITYNHLMNLDFLLKGEKILLFINKKEYEINLKVTRYFYSNEEFDITIIEILDIDCIKNFIEIDKFINSKNYNDEDIICISLTKNKKINFSNSNIIEKKDDYYICDLESHNEGIIILKDNMKLIGIIKEINMIPMNIIINKISFFRCIYNIKKEDIDKDIQIINNTYYYDKNKNDRKKEIIETNNNLRKLDSEKFIKELIDFNNEMIESIEKEEKEFPIKNKKESGKNKNDEIEKEVKIIINGEIKSNILSYRFNKEGDNIIYLVSHNELTDMSYMFSGCLLLKVIDCSFNTNHVVNMAKMFEYCSSLEKLDLSSFNTNQLTNMYGMFSNCSSLKELNLSSINTDQVTNMSLIFSNCSSLKELNLSTFNTNQVTNMESIFSRCFALEKINLSSFNTNQVTDMGYMFSNCSSLKELDLSTFNTNQVVNMAYMFNNCSSLNKLNLSSFDTNKVRNMSYMFAYCSSLKELDLSSFKAKYEFYIFHMFDSINKSCKLKCNEEKILEKFNKETDTGCIII